MNVVVWSKEMVGEDGFYGGNDEITLRTALGYLFLAGIRTCFDQFLILYLSMLLQLHLLCSVE
jgi:hypothetical protein